MYDYAMWGDGYDDSFWGYGYGDIYAGIFAPYGYDDLAGYLPQYASGNPSGSAQTAPASGTPAAAPDQLAQMCGADNRDIAGLPIDQFRQAIQPTDAQSAALDDLANASVKAAQDLKAACPTDIALTAPDRLAAMQQRIEAMIAAVQTVQPPLEKFYGLLSDEQKARLTALGQDQASDHREDPWHTRPELRCRTTRRHRMADRRDRPDGAPNRRATREPGRAPECHHPCGGYAQGLVSDRRSAHAAGAASGGRQTNSTPCSKPSRW